MYSYPQGGSAEDIAAGIAAWSACLFVFALLYVALMIWFWWRILDRAGYSGWLSLLNLIGGIGTLILVILLAFGDWPVFRSRDSQGGGYPTSGGYQQPMPPQTYQPPSAQPPMTQPAPQGPSPSAPPMGEPTVGPPPAAPEPTQPPSGPEV
jgi:hypothetical protein